MLRTVPVFLAFIFSSLSIYADGHLEHQQNVDSAANSPEQSTSIFAIIEKVADGILPWRDVDDLKKRDILHFALGSGQSKYFKDFQKAGLTADDVFANTPLYQYVLRFAVDENKKPSQFFSIFHEIISWPNEKLFSSLSPSQEEQLLNSTKALNDKRYYLAIAQILSHHSSNSKTKEKIGDYLDDGNSVQRSTFGAQQHILRSEQQALFLINRCDEEFPRLRLLMHETNSDQPTLFVDIDFLSRNLSVEEAPTRNSADHIFGLSLEAKRNLCLEHFNYHQNITQNDRLEGVFVITPSPMLSRSFKLDFHDLSQFETGTLKHGRRHWTIRRR